MHTRIRDRRLRGAELSWIEVRGEGRTAIIGKLIQELWNVKEWSWRFYTLLTNC